MTLQMYSIYDRKSEIHQPPLFMHNTGHALRTFTDIFARVDTTLHMHPSDFQIFHIGEFNDLSAEVKPCTPHLICGGAELVQAPDTIPFGKESDD